MGFSAPTKLTPPVFAVFCRSLIKKTLKIEVPPERCKPCLGSVIWSVPGLLQVSKVGWRLHGSTATMTNHHAGAQLETFFFLVWLSSAMPANENEARSFWKNKLGQKLFQNMCVCLLNVELKKLAPGPQRCDMYEPPRRRIKLLGRRGRQVQRFKYL